VLLYWLARRCFGFLAGLLTAIIYALQSNAILLGSLARVDHHVAEVMFQLWVVLLMARFAARSEARKTRVEFMRRALAYAHCLQLMSVAGTKTAGC